MAYAQPVIQFPQNRIARGGDVLAGLDLFADGECAKPLEKSAEFDPSEKTDEKWPLAKTALFVTLTSACLWSAIIFALSRLF